MCRKVKTYSTKTRRTPRHEVTTYHAAWSQDVPCVTRPRSIKQGEVQTYTTMSSCITWQRSTRTLWHDLETCLMRSSCTPRVQNVPYEVETYLLEVKTCSMKSKRTPWGQDMPFEARTCPVTSRRTLEFKAYRVRPTRTLSPSEVNTYPVRSRHTLRGQDVPCEVKTSMWSKVVP